MRKRTLQSRCGTKRRLWIPVCVLCVFAGIVSGCASKNHANATVQGDEDSSEKEPLQDEDSSEKGPSQDEDMAASPLDLEKLDTGSKIEESGISYYNFHTTMQTPLPADEWAKLELLSEKGTTVAAYIRFTDITRDTDKIEKQVNQFMEAKNIKAAFSLQPVNTQEEYAMMNYEILIGNETPLDQDDYISFSAVRFPLQIYSTMKSGKLGDQTDTAAERFVSDVSVYDAKTPLTGGSTIKKTVICAVPKEYTAYGIRIPYMNAQGESQSLYYKLEY